VARAYVDLRGAQAKRRVLGETVAADAALLKLADLSEQAGSGSRIDVVRAGAEASAAQAQLPALDHQIAADINQLSLLIAREPGALSAELNVAQPIPPAPPLVPVGLPADLARRRPDIRAAEARLHAATARVGVAVGDLYPKLTLSGQAGYQSQTLPMLTNWASRFFTAGPAVQLPIFEGGRLRAAVRLQDAQAAAAALDYRSTVLSALHEVDNALNAYAADRARETALHDAVAQNTEAADLAQQRYAGGLGGYIDVLDAQRTLQQNELLAADARTAVSVDLVVIYKALGGGWGAD
jgi:NodT family efflux transporter outer membrane factor (OMF) lipoprotein